MTTHLLTRHPSTDIEFQGRDQNFKAEVKMSRGQGRDQGHGCEVEAEAETKNFGLDTSLASRP